ncbi:hypothetical protein [Nonomuraea longicatena]|uniref:Uncharacterized protein n=1 Tax=Nonomuraea longicatena TaxID=83682 RepID=A0ABP4BBV0_9ACTN
MSQNSVSRVNDMKDFAAYLVAMADDFDADRAEFERKVQEGMPFAEGRWSSLYAGDFLRSWAAWLEDACIREGAPRKKDVEPLTWRTLARQIHAGSMYE